MVFTAILPYTMNFTAEVAEVRGGIFLDIPYGPLLPLRVTYFILRHKKIPSFKGIFYDLFAAIF